MAGKKYEIATSIKLDGEKEFDDALKAANRSMRVMDSEMKKLQAAYDTGGDGMDYLAGKADVLDREMKQQEAIVKALRKAVEEQSESYGDASEEAQKYQIRLNNAEAKLSKMTKAAQDANREMEELGRDSGKIGRQIENGIGDAAEDTASKLDRMFERVSADVEALRSNTTISAFGDVSGYITGAISSLGDFVESSRDYRRQMSFLEQNAKTYGLEFAYIKELFFEMASITGEVDSSVEALSNLMAAGFDGQLLASAVDLLGGAVIRFPDTLKFESLADGLQETLATGEATGQYAELLERLGVDVKEFNQALDDAKTAEEDQQIALAYLTKHGLADVYKGYKAVNPELLAAEEATIKLNDAMAGLGEEMEGLATWWTEAKTSGILGITNFIRGLRGKEFIEAPATNATEKLEQLEGDINRLRKLGIDLQTINETLQMDFSELATYGGGENIDSINAQTLISLFESDAWKNRAGESKNWWEYIIPSAGAESLSTPETQASFEDAGSMAWTAYISGMLSAAEETDAAFAAGQNSMISFANGIADGGTVVMSNVVSLVNAINQALAQISMPAIGYGYRGITGGNIYVSTEETINTVSRGLAQRVTTKNYLK